MTRRPVVVVSVVASVVLALAAGVAPPASATQAAKPKPPAAVTKAKLGAVASTTAALSWTNPTSKSFASVIVRVAKGSVAPKSASAGTAVATVKKPGHTLTATKLLPGTAYTFALFASDGKRHNAKGVAVHATTAPAPVTKLTATKTDTSIALAWTNPTTKSFAAVVVRYAKGATAPATPTSGTGLTLTSAKATRASLAKLPAKTAYAFAVWARDSAKRYSSVVKLAVTTNPLPGAVTGVHATSPSATSVRLTWTNPTSPDFTGVMIRRATGSTAPASITAGTLVKSVTKPTASYLDSAAIGAATTYSYALFAHDGTSHYAAAATAHITTTSAPVAKSISGTVNDDASPVHHLAGVIVTASPSTGSAHTATTAADGTYSFTGLAAGSYKLCFNGSSATGGSSTAGYRDECYNNVPWSGLANDVPAGTTSVPVTAGHTASINAVLTASSGVKGTVTSGGTALNNVLVRLFTVAGDDSVASTRTNSSGGYTFRDLPVSGDGYQLCFDATDVTGGPPTGYLDECYSDASWDGDSFDLPGGITPVPTTAGALAPVSASLAPAGGIKGTVTAATGGAGLPGVEVDIFDRFDQRVTETTTGADGKYAVTGLAPSATGYTVCFDPSGAGGTTGYLGQCSPNVTFDGQAPPGGTTPVPVTAGALATDDAALASAGAITGTVTDETTSNGVAGVEAEVFDVNDNLVADARTGSTGNYAIHGLPDAKYLVCFDASSATGAPQGYFDQCYHGMTWDGGFGDVPDGVQLVTVNGGASSDSVDAALIVAGAIAGTITTGASTPLGGVRVQVDSVDGSFETNATSASDGSYLVPGLHDGDYTVCFAADDASTGSSDPSTYDSECFNDKAWDEGDVPSTATHVPVTARATAPANANLAVHSSADTGTLTGAVTPATGGAGLSGVTVRVYNDADLDSELATAVTNSSGHYTITGLAPATDDVVCFDASAAVGGTSTTGYLSECYNDVAWSGPQSGAPTTAPTPVLITANTTATANATLAAAGAIAGTVTAAVGHGGLADVFVTLMAGPHHVVASASTDADGTYEIDGLAASSTYTVCFDARSASGGSSAAGYFDQCYYGISWNAGGSVPNNLTPVTVTLGHRTGDINATLASAGSITGKVTAAGTGGLKGITVNVYNSSGTKLASARTAGDGTYLLGGLSTASGDHVCFDASRSRDDGPPGSLGYQDQCWKNVAWVAGTPVPSATAVAVTSGSATPNINATLALAGAISGRITASDGAGIDDVTVFVYDSTGKQLETAVSGSNGSYVVTGLLPGSNYAVCFDTPAAHGGPSTTGYLDECYSGKPWVVGDAVPTGVTRKSVAAGQTVTGVDAQLTTAGGITGSTTAGGSPVRNVTVYLFLDSTEQDQTTTRLDGSYAFTGLAAGTTYQVCFDPSQAHGSSTTGYVPQCWLTQPWDADASDPGPATAISVSLGGATTGINATLEAAGAITGTVTELGGGAPLSGVAVSAFNKTGGGVVATTDTADDGTYTLAGLPGGNYAVCFEPSGASGGTADGYLAECWNDVTWDGGGTAPSGATPVSVSDGEVKADISPQLSGLATISGTVTGGGAPLSGVHVIVTGNGPENDVTTTGTGTYSLDMPPGANYVLCFGATDASGGSSPTGYASQCYNGVAWDGDESNLPSSPTKITLTSSEKLGVDVTLGAGAGITGTVTSAGDDSEPLGNVHVDVFNADKSDTSVSATTAADGTYVLTGLTSGNSYIVCFDAANAMGGTSLGGYLNECWQGVRWISAFEPPDGTTAITVNDGAANAGISPALTPSGGISGQVTAGGDGVADVTVSVFNLAGTDVEGSTVTGATGDYTITGLAAGSYYVCFDASGLSDVYLNQCYQGVNWTDAVPEGATSVGVTAGAVTPGIDAALQQEGAITGKVSQATTNDPLDNVHVTVYDADGNQVGEDFTASDGTYQVDVAPSSVGYTVCFDGASADGGNDDDNGYTAQCWNGKAWPGGDGTALPANTTPVKVGSGETVTASSSTLTGKPGGGGG